MFRAAVFIKVLFYHSSISFLSKISFKYFQSVIELRINYPNKVFILVFNNAFLSL